jgi:hypothetical protein
MLQPRKTIFDGPAPTELPFYVLPVKNASVEYNGSAGLVAKWQTRQI